MAIGHIENNGFKMSTKWGYPWISEKDNFVYVQNTLLKCVKRLKITDFWMFWRRKYIYVQGYIIRCKLKLMLIMVI